MLRFDPEASAPEAVPMRGVAPARRVVLAGGLAVISVLMAALAGFPTARHTAVMAVLAAVLLAMTASLVVLAPSRAACAVRRAALGTLSEIGFLSVLWLLLE